MLILAITGWAWGARVLRAQAISLRDRPFVEAARLSGEGRWTVVFAHCAQHVRHFGGELFRCRPVRGPGQAGLEFLGLGNINDVTWGNMLYWAENGNAVLLGEWLYLPLPGRCILLLGTAFGLLNFAVDQVANPRLRRNLRWRRCSRSRTSTSATAGKADRW